MSSPPKNAALLADIAKGEQLKHVDGPKVDASLVQAQTLAAINSGKQGEKLKHVEAGESSTLTQAKLLLEVQKKPELAHVETSGDGLTDTIKQAYLEDKKEKSSQ